MPKPTGFQFTQWPPLTPMPPMPVAPVPQVPQYVPGQPGGRGTATRPHRTVPGPRSEGSEPDDLPELLTVREAASLLRLSRSHTYDLIREGVLPVVYLGRAVRVPRRALIAWIERQAQALGR